MYQSFSHSRLCTLQISSTDDSGTVKLPPLQQFARDIRTLLHSHQGRLALSQLEPAYAAYFGVALVPASYGYPCATALLQAIPHVVTVRGRAFRRTVFLNQEYNGKSISTSIGWTPNWGYCSGILSCSPQNQTPDLPCYETFFIRVVPSF